MNLNGVFIFVIFAVGSLGEVLKNDSCDTPFGTVGKCILSSNCHINVQASKSPGKLRKSIRKHLKKSICKIDNDKTYVCCDHRHIINPKPELIDHPAVKTLLGNDCGYAEMDKIANGIDVSLGEFPWVAILLYNTPDGLRFQCGGSLISKRHVLTAAHCIKNTQYPLVEVRLGEYDLSKDDDSNPDEGFDYVDPVQNIPIEEVIVHPQYRRRGLVNDIAVIRLQREANLDSDYVQPICLPITKSLTTSVPQRMLIAGWGSTEYDIFKPILQKAEIPIRSDEDCAALFDHFTAEQLCAGGRGQGHCRGDSGGPMFHTGAYPTSSGNSAIVRYVQYGVISSGVEECLKMETYPGIQVRVPHYIEWILDQLIR